MQSIAILEILEGLNTMDVDQSAKHQFQQLVRAVASSHGVSWVERQDRTAFARDLLANRVSRPTVRERLIARFGVSRTHAYRIIDEALQLSQNDPDFGTTCGCNGDVNNQSRSGTCK
ncbi:hypothetical protein [Noviherbaspirillum pedocola]|uniref:Uncharacterized protein n=1 Tax=Noviherbaspirillum pedocola TaxID=2801341 RepID=A0A934W540_9BURK|nr:hypothetical protein [Noviherbaspirillum pedocola]MBK4739211.1 hypothetical protein [Noviherbaspirillum pedocola]